ncbi:uncharacterized protein TM35_000064890 [Trypanosoma theileri]|uniref:Uncharacterized protein n=1 Tax=Trypanosoma theileri TaxID=67003 RepID=A0A1X0P3G6_9TRYP|nr:uncharacterized protein TM35_000064890 [Trypanosoma theileri]ORC91484.1 hypothetical protein TM35_000064890 [Trypanosoma theileri]
MYVNKSKSQQTFPPGVPVAYYETCKHIEQLAALGMPQVTPYTPAPKPHITTMPVPPSLRDSDYLSSVASLTATDVSVSTGMLSRTDTPRLGTGRRRPEVEKFDLEAAYAALLKRLGKQVEEEEEEKK